MTNVAFKSIIQKDFAFFLISENDTNLTIIIFTSVVFTSPSFVANFDSADGQNNGDNKKQKASNETCGHRALFHIIRQIIFECVADRVGSGTMTEHSEQIGFGSTHVFH